MTGSNYKKREQKAVSQLVYTSAVTYLHTGHFLISKLISYSGSMADLVNINRIRGAHIIYFD